MKQAEQINLTTNISHGTLKQDNTRRETPVNERKINDRITENSGRKTVFPISFGISCSWNWQSLALPHTHTLAHSLSLCQWARIGTSDFSFSRLQSIGLFFDFRRLLFFSRFLSLASLFIADDVAVVIVYDYWLQDIAARSIVHFFFFLARCRRAQVFWHKASASHPHPLIHTDFSYTFVFHVTEDVLLLFVVDAVAIREYRLIFIAIRAPSANLHTHAHILLWWFYSHYVSKMCLLHNKSMEFIFVAVWPISVWNRTACAIERLCDVFLCLRVCPTGIQVK